MVRILATSLFASASGHGYINEPPSRTGAMKEAAGSSPYSAALWFNQGCTIGCPKCLGVDAGFKGCGSDQGEETLPDAYKTYNVDKKGCGINPWCAPGSAPIMNPCGIAGGDTKQGAAGNGGDRPIGYNIGDKGTEMRNAVKDFPKRQWVAGETAEVSWSIIANHGGGYAYRLCPASANQTEECFQQNHLEFVGDTHDIQYCELPPMGPHGEGVLPREASPDGFDPLGKGVFVDPVKYYASLPGCDKKWSRDTIPAMTVSSGTVPEGSTWRRNPVPACKSIAGGAFNMGCHVSSIAGKYKTPKSSEFQFPPAITDKSRAQFGNLPLGGFGTGACFGCNQEVNPKDCGVFGKLGRNNCTVDETNAQTFSWNIVDKVKVPKVPAGDYVVSFRWEGEQTPQIWASCSEITIVDSSVVV